METGNTGTAFIHSSFSFCGLPVDWSEFVPAVPDWFSCWEVIWRVVIDGIGFVVTKELKIRSRAVAIITTTNMTIKVKTSEELCSFWIISPSGSFSSGRIWILSSGWIRKLSILVSSSSPVSPLWALDCDDPAGRGIFYAGPVAVDF